MIRGWLAVYAAKILAGALIAALAWGGLQTWRLHTAKTEAGEARAALSDEKAARLAAANAFEKAARALERSYTDELSGLRARHSEVVSNANQERDELLGRLAAGDRLHRRFECPPAGGGGVPGTGAPGSGGDAPGEGGLSRADAAFLVRLAGSADQVALRLEAAQAELLALHRFCSAR